ncbi:MAG: fibronectin type III domain-containing protein [bacterium]|nr:fibronectin type III domain-containing protein [bacterium]
MGANFTPLPSKLNIVNDKSSTVFKSFAINSISLFLGITVVLFMLILRESNTPKTTSSQASEPTPIPCTFNKVTLPTNIIAGVKTFNKFQNISSNETIQTDSISFWWDSAEDINKYYVLLSDKDSSDPNVKINMLKDGVSTTQPFYTFDSLKPNTTYNLYIRSQNTKGELSFIYPTPNNCNFAYQTISLFKFKTK